MHRRHRRPDVAITEPRKTFRILIAWNEGGRRGVGRRHPLARHARGDLDHQTSADNHQKPSFDAVVGSTRVIFRLAYWMPTCSRLASLKDRRACLSNSHCLKVLLLSRKGCDMPPILFRWRPNRDLFPGSGTFRSSPFSSGSSRGSGGSLRLGSDTTTPCSNCSVPNQFRLGWMRLS